MTGTTALEDTTALLERTPEVLRQLLLGLPDGWLDVPDTVDGWTARDVVGHLISAELDDWIPRAEIIINHGTARPFDPFDRFAHIERDRGVPLAGLVERFAELRAQSLSRLRQLVRSDADLERRGRHPELGEVTLGQLLATWAVHDLDHVAQVFSSLAASRDEDVGQWKAYLGILLRRDAASDRGDGARAALAAFDRAMAEADADAMAEVFTDDAQLLAAMTDAVAGRQAIRRHWAQIFARFATTSYDPDYPLVDVHGDRAYALCTYTEVAQPRDGGEAVLLRGRAIYFLRRETDGAWRINLALNSLSHQPERIAEATVEASVH